MSVVVEFPGNDLQGTLRECLIMQGDISTKSPFSVHFTKISYLNISEMTATTVNVSSQKGSLKVRPPDVDPSTDLHMPINQFKIS